MKDLFSSHAATYAAFRPTYPEALYEFVFSFVKHKGTAWDCGTGNGQVASRLAKDFERVYATDISENQLKNAVTAPNIDYSLTPAEKTSFPEDSFDLITVGQALHWFDLDKFYAECRRVGKPASVIALWGYGNIMINREVDSIVDHLYTEVVGKYWDSARRHVETAYRDIPFPFDSRKTPSFFIEAEWTLAHLIGYLESWSATQKYMKENGVNPVKNVEKQLLEAIHAARPFPIRFPVFLKLGSVK
jgi:SAM-dependent methyltransferase